MNALTRTLIITALVTSCGSAALGSEAVEAPPNVDAAADAGEPAATTAPAANVVLVDTAQAVADFLPLTIGPLADIDPTLTVEDAFAVVDRDPVAARFFAADADRAAATVRLGSVTDASDTTPGVDPTVYPGYVIEGGESTCLPSRPAGAAGEAATVRCTALIVLNATTGEVARVSEIGHD